MFPHAHSLSSNLKITLWAAALIQDILNNRASSCAELLYWPACCGRQWSAAVPAACGSVPAPVSAIPPCLLTQQSAVWTGPPEADEPERDITLMRTCELFPYLKSYMTPVIPTRLFSLSWFSFIFCIFPFHFTSWVKKNKNVITTAISISNHLNAASLTCLWSFCWSLTTSCQCSLLADGLGCVSTGCRLSCIFFCCNLISS